LGMIWAHFTYLSPQMLQILIIHREIARKHAGGDLATVGAVAHEDVGEAGAFCRESKLHGATETGRCSFGVVAVAVVRDSAEGEVREVFGCVTN
jgi:hypothetical protein